MTIATATEMQNNFGKYLQIAQDEGEVVIVKNGKEVARLVSRDQTVSFLSDQLAGILKDSDVDDQDVRAERMKRYEEYETAD